MAGEILLAWGPHMFQVGSMSYEELMKHNEGRWMDHDIVGRRPAGQYLGPGHEAVRVMGCVYPLEQTGAEDALIEGLLADVTSGRVYSLISASGDVMGVYRCQRADKRGSMATAAGQDQKIFYEFTFVPQEEGDGPTFGAWP